MTASASIADIKALLQARIRELVPQLVPDGAWKGPIWSARNPTRDDRHRGSFVVWTQPQACGAWKDYATGDAGDVLALIGYTQGFDFKTTMVWARDWLGLRGAVPPSMVQAAVRATRQRELAEQYGETDTSGDLATKRKRAFAMWLRSYPHMGDCKPGSDRPLRYTLAETYLASRGIDLSKLRHPPRALRFSPEMWHVESRSAWPCLVACMTGPDETIWAVHRTWLRPDGSGKADVEPARKIWPSYRGAAIRLALGKTGLRPREAEKQGLLDTLALVEGIEDGLSVALAKPDWRVWAAGSLTNLQHIIVPACSDEVVVCADNDWGKPQAEAQLDRALQALVRQGCRVFVARSPVGKDFNDCLRGQAA